MMPGVKEVWLAVQPIDMRAGIDGLSLRIQEALGRAPCDGSAYAFRNRRGTRVKLLVWGALFVGGAARTHVRDFAAALWAVRGPDAPCRLRARPPGGEIDPDAPG
jgi:transposase